MSGCGDWPSPAPLELDPLPPDTEERIAEFAELVATAIAAATTRADLIASRARIVAAADGARRRLERDLHDGAQQRLVTLKLKLRLAQDSVPSERIELKEELTEMVSDATEALKELQEISRGIHPAILSAAGCPRRSKRWRTAPRCPSTSTSLASNDCPTQLRSPLTTWWPRHSPMPPSTLRPPR